MVYSLEDKLALLWGEAQLCLHYVLKEKKRKKRNVTLAYMVTFCYPNVIINHDMSCSDLYPTLM